MVMAMAISLSTDPRPKTMSPSTTKSMDLSFHNEVVCSEPLHDHSGSSL